MKTIICTTSMLLAAIVLTTDAQDTNVLRRKLYPTGHVEKELVQVSGAQMLERGYYESGSVWWEIPYHNGMKNGAGHFYYTNGQLESVWFYEDNRGRALEKFDETGKKKQFVRTRDTIGRFFGSLGGKVSTWWIDHFGPATQ